MKTIFSLTILLSACSTQNPYIAEDARLRAYYMAHPIEAYAVASTPVPDYTDLLHEMNERTVINAQSLSDSMPSNYWTPSCY